MLSRSVKMLPVIAYDEIIPGTEVEPVETIRFESVQEPLPQSGTLGAPGLVPG